MNSEKRTVLKNAISLLERVIVSVDSVCDKEQDAIDNYPENLQSTDVYGAMENAVENLEDALERLDEAKNMIEAAAS